MRKIKESLRIKEIENKWNNSIENLLYQWHWKENLMHKEIGIRLGIPRPTVTRWFKQLGIPSQSCTRFTNNNLRYVGPNRLPKKPKPPKKPHFRLPVNENFFKKWTPEMAYVLGFFTADGHMFINPNGSHYIGFTSTDYNLITKIREILNSNHKIGKGKYENCKNKFRYRLQIGGRKLFQDLLNHGLIPNKSRRIKLPNIPKTYFNHFCRGLFDGDGCVDFGFYLKKGRKKPGPNLLTRFSSGNRKFLEDLLKFLKIYAGIRGGCIYQKPEGGYDLSFSVRDSFKLYEFIYKDAKENQFLERKYNEFQQAIRYYAGVA